MRAARRSTCRRRQQPTRSRPRGDDLGRRIDVGCIGIRLTSTSAGAGVGVGRRVDCRRHPSRASAVTTTTCSTSSSGWITCSSIVGRFGRRGHDGRSHRLPSRRIEPAGRRLGRRERHGTRDRAERQRVVRIVGQLRDLAEHVGGHEPGPFERLEQTFTPTRQLLQLLARHVPTLPEIGQHPLAVGAGLVDHLAALLLGQVHLGFGFLSGIVAAMGDLQLGLFADPRRLVLASRSSRAAPSSARARIWPAASRAVDSTRAVSSPSSS